jgi:hypothetical protein
VHVGTRLRRALARRPWIRWLVVAGCAAAAAVGTMRLDASVTAERDSWGRTRSVVVATRTVRPGEPLAGATTDRRLPVAALPAEAVDEVVGSAVARRRLSTGEVVTTHDVASDRGPLAFTPPGHVAVPVVESVASGAELGDAVVITADGVILASGTLAGSDDGVTVVAVPADDGPAVAASANGVVLLRIP